MNEILKLLGNAAPAIGTALAGPLGGAAVAAIANKLGVSETVEAVAAELAGNPEALAKVKELELEFAKVDAGDRDSARKMQIAAIAAGDWFTRNFVHLLAIVVVVGSGTLLAVSKEQDVRMAAVSFVTFVLGFYYGTSQSSQKKSEVISALAK